MSGAALPSLPLAGFREAIRDARQWCSPWGWEQVEGGTPAVFNSSGQACKTACCRDIFSLIDIASQHKVTA